MPTTKSPPRVVAPPVLRVTRYDRTAAGLIAIVIALVAALAWLSIVWITNRLPPKTHAAPLELIELAGGDEEGAIDETLRLDSPEPESSDPSLAETPADESEIQEMLENVVELSDLASNQAQQLVVDEAENVGKPGSASGTGLRPLGLGSGKAGLPREQRWYIRFSDRETLRTYARQLDFFGIELAVLTPEGKMVFVSGFSTGQPQVRRINSGEDETRLFMTWQGGERKQADIQLLDQAGVGVGVGMIFQFYPAATEQLLAQAERGYRGRPAEQIRRTYFVVHPEGEGFKFTVTRQTYFR